MHFETLQTRAKDVAERAANYGSEISDRTKDLASSTAEKVSERIHDSEFQKRLRYGADIAIDGAFGSSGLGIIERDPEGNIDIKKGKSTRIALRALRNPIGVAQKAGRGIYKEAKGTAIHEGIDATKSWLNHE